MRLMLRTLLAERFNLVVRQETRTAPVFELMPAAGGIKFAAAKEGDCIILGPASPPPLSLPPAPMPNICGWSRNSTLRQTSPRIVRLEGAGVPMSDLIRRLQPGLGGIIVDRTGVTETFSFPSPLFRTICRVEQEQSRTRSRTHYQRFRNRLCPLAPLSESNSAWN